MFLLFLKFVDRMQLWLNLDNSKGHSVHEDFASVSVRNSINIQGVPGGKVNILGGHSIGHSKQESMYVHVFYSERFPR
jgi:hypothetical protein